MNRYNWGFFALGFFFVCLSALAAAFLNPFGLNLIPSVALGFLAGGLALLLSYLLRQLAPKVLAAGLVGGLVGTGVGLLFVHVLTQAAFAQGLRGDFLRMVFRCLAYTLAC